MRVRRGAVRAAAFAAGCLALAGGPLTAQPRGDAGAPSDRAGAPVRSRQMTRDDLAALLRALQQAPQSPEEQRRLLELMERFKDLPPEKQQAVGRQIEQEYGKDFLPDLAKKLAPLPGNIDPSQLPNNLKDVGDLLKPGAKSGPQPGAPPPPPFGPGPRPPGVSSVPPPPPMGQPGGPGPGPGQRAAWPPPGPGGNDQLRDRPDLQRLIGFWEQNIGPLDRTPALKEAIYELANSAAESGGPGGPGGPDGGGFLSFLERQGAEAGDFGKFEWLGKAFEGGSWKLPELGLKGDAPKWSGPGGDWGGPSRPSSSYSGGGFGMPGGVGGGGSLGTLLLLAAIAAAAFLVWRYWPGLRTGAGGLMDLSRRPWPVDPQAVDDRESLVRAFEYLSVLLCGDAAKVWHHRTIAAALRARVAEADAVADELATLYEVARYTPPGEPLSPAALAAARRCLCHLAGVPAA